MKKKVLYLLPFLLFIFLFSGCSSESVDLSNSITFSIEILKTGQITQTITFPTQEDQFSLSETEKNKYIAELEREIKTNLFFPFYYNFYVISATSKNLEYRIGGEKMTYNLPTYDEANKTISFSFSFADSDVWNYYHKTDEESSGMKIKEGFFISEGVSENNFVFSEKMTVNGKQTTIGKHFYTVLSTVQEKYFSEETKKPSFAYKYSHFSNKLHTNSDYQEKANGQFISIWKEEFEGLESEKNVQIILYSPNRAVWYSIALGGTILALGVTCLARYLILRAKTRKEKI